MGKRIAIAVLLATSLALPAQAGFGDWLRKLMGGGQGQSNSLSRDEVVRGLKAALVTGARRAIGRLGKEGGFLDDARVRIPVPPRLRKVERLLRRLGLRRYADRFVAAMNHAAERSVREALPVFRRAIREMTFADAMRILRGGEHAATDYFRRKTSASLVERMLPIVSQATRRTGVTRHYKRLVSKLPFGRRGRDYDLDLYVTRRAVDGLFLMMAAEEARIRRDPVARTTAILRKVFGRR